jgi:anaerobic selenocysteine-containing dehydrogenase
MGFSATEALAEVRQFKLAGTSETRDTCPYCSAGCGIIMHGLGDGSKNARTDHPRRGGSARSTAERSAPRGRAWWTSSTVATA